MGAPDGAADVSANRRWYRFGVAIGLSQLVFLGVLLVLLQWNVAVALGVAVVASVVGGIAVTAYALRRA